MSAKLLLFRKVFPGFLAVMAMGFMQADAQMITGNFTEGAGGTEWTLGDNVSGGGPGLPTISAGKLNITQDISGTGGTSAYYNTKQDISSSFSASFTWTLNSGTPGDGFLFSIQNGSLTPIGIGYIGGGQKGYTTGVSIGIENYGPPRYLELVVPGVTTQVDLTSSGLDCATSGKIINFNIAYDGVNSFSVDLTQGITAFNHTFTLGGTLASVIGASTSYVGFTGGSGGATESQTISNFNLGPVPEPGTWALLALTGTFFMVTRRGSRG